MHFEKEPQNSNRKYLMIDGLSVELVDPVRRNNAPTIIFLHGATLNARSMEPAVKHFSQKGFPSVIIDTRGHGRSIRPDNFCTSRFVDYRSNIEKVLTNLKQYDIQNDQCILFGHSMGGLWLLTMQLDIRSERSSY